MATTTALLVLLSLSAVALTAHARPCKTLFFYTAATTSYYHPSSDSNSNPSLDSFYAFQKSQSDSPKFFTFFLTTTRASADADTDGETHRPRVSFISLRRTPFHLYYTNRAASNKLAEQDESESESNPAEETEFPIGVVSTRSIKDRTKDIMSVVGALLFGVGCGALTAATMFLIWSLCAPHRFDFEDSEGEDGDDDDDENRKFGYVTIPDDIDMIKKAIAAAAQKKAGYEAIPEDVKA